MSLIEVNLGSSRHYLTQTEAGLVNDWLRTTPSAGAVLLMASLSEAIGAERPRAIRLGLDDIAALRKVLCEQSRVGGSEGLEELQRALCHG